MHSYILIHTPKLILLPHFRIQINTRSTTWYIRWIQPIKFCNCRAQAPGDHVLHYKAHRVHESHAGNTPERQDRQQTGLVYYGTTVNIVKQHLQNKTPGHPTKYVEDDRPESGQRPLLQATVKLKRRKSNRNSTNINRFIFLLFHKHPLIINRLRGVVEQQ